MVVLQHFKGNVSLLIVQLLEYVWIIIVDDRTRRQIDLINSSVYANKIELHAKLPSEVGHFENSLALEFSSEVSVVDQNCDEGDDCGPDVVDELLLEHLGEDQRLLDDRLFGVFDLVTWVLRRVDQVPIAVPHQSVLKADVEARLLYNFSLFLGQLSSLCEVASSLASLVLVFLILAIFFRVDICQLLLLSFENSLFLCRISVFVIREVNGSILVAIVGHLIVRVHSEHLELSVLGNLDLTIDGTRKDANHLLCKPNLLRQVSALARPNTQPVPEE